jgi:hypothetical protein
VLDMLRYKSLSLVVAFVLATLSAQAQDATAAAAVQNYFQGKEVIVLLDMPGTQKGVDLNFSKPNPMDWKEYSGRIKGYGVAIPKGSVARVTGLVVKKDRIEFQLDGGGFGTFGDDSNATVTAKPMEKSSYEKSLESQIANTNDPDRKADLQRDLNRERSRREREDAANRRAAQIASQIKAQQIMDSRVHGGSRFNLRWQGKIPDSELTPEGIAALLANYVTLDNGAAPEAADYGPPAGSPPPGYGPHTTAPPPPATGGAATGQLQRGMLINQVNALLGPGKLISDSTAADGLKTEVYKYVSGERETDVTYVSGVVVRFSITSK